MVPLGAPQCALGMFHENTNPLHLFVLIAWAVQSDGAIP